MPETGNRVIVTRNTCPWLTDENTGQAGTVTQVLRRPSGFVVVWVTLDSGLENCFVPEELEVLNG